MDDIQKLRDELAALNQRLSSTVAGTAAVPSTAAEEPKTEPGQKAETPVTAPPAAELPTLVGTAVSYPSAADVAKMVADGITAAMPTLQQGVKSHVDEALSSARSPRQMTFEQSDAASGSEGGPGGGTYLRRTSNLQNPSTLDWLLAVGRKALGASSVDEISSIRYALDKKALAEGNLSALVNPGSDYGAGGALAPVEFDRQLIEYLYPLVVMRRAGVQVINMKAAELVMPRIITDTGNDYPVQGTSLSEGDLIQTSRPAFNHIVLRPQKLGAMVAVSRELVMDSDPAVEQIIRSHLAESLAHLEDKRMLTGTGTPPDLKGIFDYGTADGAAVSHVNGSLEYDDLVDAITTLQSAKINLTRGAWICHPVILGDLRKLKDQNDRPLFSNLLEVQQGSVQVNTLDRVPKLFEMPLYLSQQLPTDQGGSNNQTTMCLVDLAYAKIGQRGGLEVDSSTEAAYTDTGAGSSTMRSSYQNNEVLFRATERVDWILTRPEALVVLDQITY